MPIKTIFQHVSAAPTNPQPAAGPKAFDVADLYATGPVADMARAPDGALPLDEKLRQAYFWIVNHAIISPHYDLEYFAGPHQSYTFGDSKTRQPALGPELFQLRAAAAAELRRAPPLPAGGRPGRGKTATAILMGVLAGYPLAEVRRAMQHGQPQMTISDLLGNPLPADLVNAAAAWTTSTSPGASGWAMRVKIIDEYNRIPTRTQSRC